MRYLIGEEAKEADRYIAEAVGEAGKSRCQKSRRGVVIVKMGRL